jgi:hypothetical protein
VIGHRPLIGTQTTWPLLVDEMPLKRQFAPASARVIATEKFCPSAGGQGSMPSRARRRRQSAEQETQAAGRDAPVRRIAAWHVRAALFWLAVAALFKPSLLPPLLPLTVETTNGRCGRLALAGFCADGRAYLMEAFCPGTCESAERGEPQESDTQECKRTMVMSIQVPHGMRPGATYPVQSTFGVTQVQIPPGLQPGMTFQVRHTRDYCEMVLMDKLGSFYKHYSACERCRLAEIKFNRSRASLTCAGQTRSAPVMDVPPPAASPSPPSPPPARPPLEPPSASPRSHQRRPQRGRRRSPSPPSPPPLPPSASPPPSHQRCASPGALNCAG